MITVAPPPGFVVAEFGVRHDLSPVFHSFWDFIGDDSINPVSFDFELLDPPTGLMIDAAGVLEWIPAKSLVGTSGVVNLTVVASREGRDDFSQTFSFSLAVLAELPDLLLETEPDLGSWRRFESTVGLEPFLDTDDREFFRWSLLDPPAGVFIDGTGGIHWPTDEVYEGIVDLPVGVRIELETPGGFLEKELRFTQRLLPVYPSLSWLKTWTRKGRAAGAQFGFSQSAQGGWIAVGEPFIGFFPADSGGRVFLAPIDREASGIGDPVPIVSSAGAVSESFGASVDLSAGKADLPDVLAVGAPEAASGTIMNRGRVEVFERTDDDGWRSVADLGPSVSQADLYFGGWVSVDGDTLVASAEGADSAGAFTGAVEVFQRDEQSAAWSHRETLTAPDAGAGDYFGWPCAVSGDWIAVAANEDDDAGANAGAVHLFVRSATGFDHAGKLYGPEPQAGALFGERLCLDGEWLFVGAPRQDTGAGAVFVFRRSEQSWTFSQRLPAPFVEAGSGFGFAIARDDETLVVSAPGAFAVPETYPWIGITRYRLVEGEWRWYSQVPTSDSRSDLYGFSLSQAGPDATFVGAPYHGKLNQGRFAAGIVQRIDWPRPPVGERFEDALAALGPEATEAGDADGDGIPNLLQWAMGEPLEMSPFSLWRRHPEVSRPHLVAESERNGVRLLFLPLDRGFGMRAWIEASDDLRVWSERPDARWEAIEYNERRGTNGVLWQTPMQPVFLPSTETMPDTFFRLRVENVD